MLVDHYKKKWWKFMWSTGKLYIWTIGNHDKMCMLKSGKVLLWMWWGWHEVLPWAEKILTIWSFVNSSVESGSETFLSRYNLCRRTTLQIFGQHKLDLVTFVLLLICFHLLICFQTLSTHGRKVILGSVRWRTQMIKIQSMKFLIS